MGNTRAALLALRTRLGASGPVVLILPAHLTLTKLIRTPRVGVAQREKVIRYEARQSLPYSLTDVVWDSIVAGEGVDNLEVSLFAAKLDVVEALCATVQAAGFEPRLILPAPLATLAVFRLMHPAPAGSSLVANLGAHATTLLFAAPERFVVRTLPWRNAGLTGSAAGNQDCAGANDASRPAGFGAESPAGSGEALATRLAQEISRSVLHFRQQSGLVQPARIHLTGSGSRLAGIAGALSAKLKVPVDHLEALGAIDLARGAVEKDAARHAPVLADLIGAAATQLRPGQSVPDLLPPRLRREKDQRRRQPWLVAAAVLVAAALLPLIWHYRTVSGEARRQTAAIERALAPLRERDAHNRANLRQLDELRRQVAQLQGVHVRRDNWLYLLADLADRLGRIEDVWLEKLQVTPAGDGAPLHLRVSGRMLDKTNPLVRVSPEITNRAKALLGDICRSPFVQVMEEEEHFHNDQPGILKFDFVLVASPAHPL